MIRIRIIKMRLLLIALVFLLCSCTIAIVNDGKCPDRNIMNAEIEYGVMGTSVELEKAIKIIEEPPWRNQEH